MKRVYLTLTHSSPAVLDPTGLYRVDIIRCGKWDYPRPGGDGGFEITPAVIKELADNFNGGIMGAEVPVNVDHEEEDGKPGSLSDCGWVKGVEVTPDGKTLVGLIDVTDPDVKTKVDNGSLKFSSAELDFERVCPELSAGGDTRPRIVLEGLALTNHPYIKRMNPISPAIMLSDRAALNAAGVHYPSVMADDDPEETPVAGVNGGQAKEAPMPEEITLTDLQKENDALKARLAELEKNPDAKAALAEAKRLGQDIKLRDTEDSVRKLVRRGKVSPVVATRLLRFAEILIKGNGATLTLSEPVAGRKYKLAEGDSDDPIDKLDVIQEVVDMLGELPDAVAMDPTQANLAEDDDPKDKGDDDEELMKEADKVQASDPKLSRREAYAKARKNLAEKKGGNR